MDWKTAFLIASLVLGVGGLVYGWQTRSKRAGTVLGLSGVCFVIAAFLGTC